VVGAVLGRVAVSPSVGTSASVTELATPVVSCGRFQRKQRTLSEPSNYVNSAGLYDTS